MSTPIITVFVLVLLVIQTANIFGKLTTLRGPTHHKKRKVICFSEDDGSALVWNTDVTYKYYTSTYIIEPGMNKFPKLCSLYGSQIDCQLDDNQGCMEWWNRKHWTLTTSINTPMGLVFDQRWEAFKEYTYDKNSIYDIKLLNTNTIILPFSVRAKRDVHILICSERYETDLCYWVIIGGWKNTRSVIRKCPTGLPPVGKYPQDGSECIIERAFINHTALAAYEWRSFIFMWNSETRNISLYDSDQLIMTYMDMEQYNKANFTYKMYIKSLSLMLIRYHDYKYLYTNTQGATLTSNIFYMNSNDICFQMLIGLCAECDAVVSLRTSDNEILHNITVNGSSVAAVHGLPMWQSVKFTANIANSYNNLQIVVTPKLNLYNSNPVWSIANIRQCSSDECTRNSAKYLYKDYDDWSSNEGFWPNVTCQKLFYKEQSVINVFEDADLNVELDDKNCPVGYIGPACKIRCASTLETKPDCKSVVICNDNGCTCTPGYSGPQCGTSCDNYFYGHGCKKRCGSCLYDKPCDRVSGVCHNGCKNMQDYFFIPPLCQIGIDRPNETQITFTNQTTIVATVPMKWTDEYEGVQLSYAFKITTRDKQFVEQHESRRIYGNSTKLVDTFINLRPGTIYDILCILFVNNEVIAYGDWKAVETRCDSIENFYITANETSLKIIIGESENQLHPCPINLYDVLLKKNENQNERKMSGTILSFPYTVSNLTPYTFYNVTILIREKKLFSKEVRTLEGVPSEVLNLQALPLSSANVSLFWFTPSMPNGVIKEYVVYLTIIKYFGCENSKQPPSNNYTIVERTNKTEITILGLHAYAKYDVSVMAYNSRYSSKPTRTTFQLNASVIPAVTFSRLRIENWSLLWNPPEDCTTILGPLIVATVEIQGTSDAVQNFSVTRNTKYNNIDLKELYGTEKYVAKIFVRRGYGQPINTSAYEKYEFETPPKAPPAITNLEVVEVENRKTIYLRWQSPRPPLNGVLQNYIIRYYPINNRYKPIEVRLNETCNFWDNYICKKIDYADIVIQVVAYNMGVDDSSVATSVTKAMLDNTTPDAPGNFTFTIGNNSVTNLKWLHPWRTGRHLHHFSITIEKIASKLKGRARRSIKSNPYLFRVDNYMPNYSKLLYLSPSTQYNISIKSVTIKNKESETSMLSIWTPSTVNFNGNITSDVYESDSTIAVNIPHITNDTRNSKLYIIVKGPHGNCDNYIQPHKSLWEQADVQENDIFWQAVAISTRDIFKNMVFVLGNEDTYGNGTNCPLVSGELYHITVIIKEQNIPYEPITITRKITRRIGMKRNHPESWLIPILIILVVAAAVFYFFRSRKQQKSNKQIMLQDEMILSQNIETYEHDTKSVISDSKQAPSTPSDRQSLSRATTPEVTTIVVENNYEEKEITSLVKVKDFEDYVKKAIESGLLDKQYETFPRGQTQPWDYGKQPQNKTKNRYGNLIAYDETRVILKKLPDDAYSDYINANYITGYKKKKRYIATQGPKPNTVVDFWRMIWQENVLIICMLANVIENGKTKCEQYWPDIGKKKKYGEIIVLNATHNVFADYCFRTLHVTYEKETRKVEHLHYTAWPDHGVPMYTHSVVTYLKKLLATSPGDGPVLVHCSAGVGRTGTIILCDICLHRAAAEGVVDVFAETASIRRERANMVDNKQQYLLAHLALVECLLTIPTTLPCNETLPTRIKELKKQLSMQQQRLQNTAWQDEALRPVMTPSLLSERNRAKNRFPELISDKVSRIYLKRYPTSDEDSDYLSAVYVDGVKLQNQYLATQLPMPSTINDFWRMIAEFKVELIVMLQPSDPKDSTCCAIAPASGEFKPTPYLNITAKEVVELENYTLQKLLLINNSEKPSKEQPVTILCCTEWKPGRNQPPPPVMTMVTFWQATERIARGDGPTVILCHDGVTGCGLYLALSFMLERMAVERECDVCLAVRAVRRSRPDFVRSLEHLEYLYDAAMTYLEYFETYANFS